MQQKPSGNSTVGPRINIACDYSLKAEYTGENQQEEIHSNLVKAFSLKPALIRHSLEELDLKWYKDNCREQYWNILGRFYASSFNQL